MPPLFRVDGDAGLFQPEIGDVRMPADREHHLIRRDARSARQMRGEFVAVLVDLLDGAAGEDGDALLLHLGAHMGADVLVETAQDVVAAIDHRHVGAEAGEDAGEFQRDIAAALDHDALRQFGQMKRLVRGDHVLDAGNFAGRGWARPGRDQDVFRGDRFAGRQPQRVGVLEHRAGLDDARAGSSRHWWCRCPRAARSPCPCWRPASASRTTRRNGPAETGGVLDLVMDVRAEHEQLFRHAAADHAGAAHPVLFGDHDPGAVAGGDAGGAHAARTSADDEQIDVELSHAQPQSCAMAI